jgi:hypothetical protein
VPKPKRLLEEWMKAYGFDNPEEAVRAVLQHGHDRDAEAGSETLASIHEGMADAEAGRTKSWAVFEKEWFGRNSEK